MNEIISELFEELVAAAPKDFNFKLQVVVRAFLDCTIAPSIYEPGEANDCFNPVLTRPLTGDVAQTHRTHCTAAVLYGLSRKAENKSQDSLGWKALNQDAKGWCCNLLQRDAPSNATEPALRELCSAKSFVGRLVVEAGLLPMEPLREPPHRLAPGDLIDPLCPPSDE